MRSKLGFLLFNQFEDLDFFGPWEILSLWSQQFNGPELFLISEHTGQVSSIRGLSIQTTTTFEQCPTLDFLLVPGGQGTRKEVSNHTLINFIKRQALQAQHILSVCTGAFLLQAAGLLENKHATTHWASINRLREFPKVHVLESRFVRDNNIWTSAGVSAGIDLSLAFVAAIAGNETAGNIQLYAEYYPSTIIYPTKQKLPNYL